MLKILAGTDSYQRGSPRPPMYLSVHLICSKSNYPQKAEIVFFNYFSMSRVNLFLLHLNLRSFSVFHFSHSQVTQFPLTDNSLFHFSNIFNYINYVLYKLCFSPKMLIHFANKSRQVPEIVINHFTLLHFLVIHPIGR